MFEEISEYFFLISLGYLGAFIIGGIRSILIVKNKLETNLFRKFMYALIKFDRNNIFCLFSLLLGILGIYTIHTTHQIYEQPFSNNQVAILTVLMQPIIFISISGYFFHLRMLKILLIFKSNDENYRMGT